MYTLSEKQQILACHSQHPLGGTKFCVGYNMHPQRYFHQAIGLTVKQWTTWPKIGTEFRLKINWIPFASFFHAKILPWGRGVACSRWKVWPHWMDQPSLIWVPGCQGWTFLTRLKHLQQKMGWNCWKYCWKCWYFGWNYLFCFDACWLYFVDGLCEPWPEIERSWLAGTGTGCTGS